MLFFPPKLKVYSSNNTSIIEILKKRGNFLDFLLILSLYCFIMRIILVALAGQEFLSNNPFCLFTPHSQQPIPPVLCKDQLIQEHRRPLKTKRVRLRLVLRKNHSATELSTLL
jgi:hypothetical protein